MKATTKQRTYSPEQTMYLVAKALVEELKAAAAAILGECTAETDEEIDAYCEREATVHTELGTLQAVLAFNDAEQALLEWGVALAKRSRPEEAALLDRLAQTPIMKYRKMGIDLIMRLDVQR